MQFYRTLWFSITHCKVPNLLFGIKINVGERGNKDCASHRHKQRWAELASVNNIC